MTIIMLVELCAVMVELCADNFILNHFGIFTLANNFLR